MCVVSHGCGGLAGGRDGGGGRHAGQSQVVVVCRKMPEYFQSAR